LIEDYFRREEVAIPFRGGGPFKRLLRKAVLNINILADFLPSSKNYFYKQLR